MRSRHHTVLGATQTLNFEAIVRYVLAPRPDEEVYAQDYFVYDLSQFYHFTLLRGQPGGRYVNVDPPPELIISHNPSHRADAAFIASYGREAPVVSHMHCQYNFTVEKVPGAKENLDQSLEAGYTNIGVVPARFLKEDMEIRFPYIDWRVVHNGARKSIYYPSTTDERDKFRKANGIPSDKKLVGFVGRLQQEKGLRFLEAIAERIQEANACLFIHFPYWKTNNRETNKQREEFLAIANSLKEEWDGVYTYRDTCPRFPNRPMRFFDTLVMPSLSEVAPMVVLESLACGVPVVVTRSSGFYEELEHLGIAPKYCKVIDLPEQFDVGANPGAEFEDKFEFRDKVDEILSELNFLISPTDNERLTLERLSDEQGLSDATMYSQFIDIYNEALELPVEVEDVPDTDSRLLKG